MLAITAEMATIAEAALVRRPGGGGQARRACAAKAGQPRAGPKRSLAELKETAALLEIVVSQARRRIAGDMPDGGSEAGRQPARQRCPPHKERPPRQARRVRPQGPSRGQLRRYRSRPQRRDRQPPGTCRCWLQQSSASRGAPSACPDAVTADRGYGEQVVGEAITTLGVREVVLPTKGKPSAPRRGRESTGVPRPCPVENWLRGPDQLPQTRTSRPEHGLGWTGLKESGLGAAMECSTTTW